MEPHGCVAIPPVIRTSRKMRGFMMILLLASSGTVFSCIILVVHAKSRVTISNLQVFRGTILSVSISKVVFPG